MITKKVGKYKGWKYEITKTTLNNHQITTVICIKEEFKNDNLKKNIWDELDINEVGK